MKKTFLFLALALLTLQANAQAHRYDVNNDGKVNVADVMILVNKIVTNTAEPPEYPLTFTVKENPLMPSEGSTTQQAPRRTPEVTTATLKQFEISWMYEDPVIEGDYFFFDDSGDYSFTYYIDDDEPGYYENNQSWPSDINSGEGADMPLTVFGFSSGSFIRNDAQPYLEFEIDESSSDQADLIVAKNSKTWNESKGNVSLTFNHACSAFQFYVKKSEGLADYTLEVSEMVLHNIIKEGQYYLMNDTWKLDDKYANYTLWAYKSGDYLTVTDQQHLLNANAQDYSFIIPQTIVSKLSTESVSAAGNKSYIEIKCKITKDNQVCWPKNAGDNVGFASVYLPFNPTFSKTGGVMKKGYIYPIVINIGTAIRDANGDKIILQ